MSGELKFTLPEARRIALAALGFRQPRPRRAPNARDVRAVIHRLGLIQLDFVNLLVPAHYQVLFSRLGPYKRSILDDLAYRKREFTEQWAHVASIIPMDLWPVLRHRMAERRFWPYGFSRIMDAHPDYVAHVLEHVRANGPVRASELSHPEGADWRLPGTWGATVPRATLEAHFSQGDVAVTRRLSDFSRVYDAAERVIPAEHRQREIGREESQRELLRRAAKALGIGTAADLADYFRMPVREARPPIEQLVEAGELHRARVEGWRETAFLFAGAAAPSRIDAKALLSPFDPLIWYRPRTARLFGFEYRFEIFVPEGKVRWGRYVLPFLMGERLVARVDLKADRPGRRLVVQAAFLEEHAAPQEVAPALAAELRLEAEWLGMETVAVESKSGFDRILRRSL